MNTLHQLLARLKDKILKERVVAPVYHIQCDSCDASNIGQTEDRKKHGFWSIEDPAPPPRKRQNVFIYRQSRTSSGYGWSSSISSRTEMVRMMCWRGDTHQDGSAFPEQRWGNLHPSNVLRSRARGASSEDRRPIRIVARKLLTPPGASSECLQREVKAFM